MHTVTLGGERGSVAPGPAECVISKCLSANFFCFFFLSLKLRGFLHRGESCVEAKNLDGQTQPHLESHGVSCSQKDPQRQLGFVGTVAPQTMRTSCHTQGCRQETEIC